MTYGMIVLYVGYHCGADVVQWAFCVCVYDHGIVILYVLRNSVVGLYMVSGVGVCCWIWGQCLIV